MTDKHGCKPITAGLFTRLATHYRAGVATKIEQTDCKHAPYVFHTDKGDGWRFSIAALQALIKGWGGGHVYYSFPARFFNGKMGEAILRVPPEVVRQAIALVAISQTLGANDEEVSR